MDRQAVALPTDSGCGGHLQKLHGVLLGLWPNLLLNSLALAANPQQRCQDLSPLQGQCLQRLQLPRRVGQLAWKCAAAVGPEHQSGKLHFRGMRQGHPDPWKQPPALPLAPRLVVGLAVAYLEHSRGLESSGVA